MDPETKTTQKQSIRQLTRLVILHATGARNWYIHEHHINMFTMVCVVEQFFLLWFSRSHSFFYYGFRGRTNLFKGAIIMPKGAYGPMLHCGFPPAERQAYIRLIALSSAITMSCESWICSDVSTVTKK